MLEPPPHQNPKRSLAALLVALVAGAAFLIALAQNESGRYFTKTVSLERQMQKAKPSSEFCYRLTLPTAFREDERTGELGVVLEDGEPLPLRIEKIKHVGQKGYGRYRMKLPGVYLSTPDNSDPRSNGRTYKLRAPRNVRPVVLWLPLVIFAGALFYLQRTGSPLPRLPMMRPWVEPALIVLIAGGAMLWAMGYFSDHSDGFLIVKGKPFSDGIGWVELGKGLSEGRGFSGSFEAHRGGYPILLGSVFSLGGGGSVLLAKLFNALMLTLGATAIYFFAKGAFGRPIALMAFFGLLTGASFCTIGQVTITEPTGFALAAIGLHQLQRAFISPALWRFGVVGIFFGLSNLVRPFTLLSLPIFGGLILWLAWRERWGWKRFAMLGAAYVGGAMLIFAPWVLRQKKDWDVATLDLNSAVMLYGAAAKPDKESQKRFLSSRHYLEGDAAGFARGDHGPRYHYFMDRYKTVVAEDPGGYRAFVAGRFVDFFEVPGFKSGHVREQLGVVFFLLLAWLAWRRRLAPLVLLAGLWPLIGKGLAAPPALIIVLAGTISALVFLRGRARLAVVILAMTLGGAGVLNALVGNFALNRGTIFVEWIVLLLVTAGLFGVARVIAPRESTLERDVTNGRANYDSGGRFADAYPLVLLAILACGFLLMVGKNLFASDPDFEAWKLSSEVVETARATVAEKQSDVVADDLYISRVKLGEYRWHIRAGEDFGHWARPFEVRPFERTMAMPLAGYKRNSFAARQITVNLPGDQTGLDGDANYVLVGLRNVDKDAELSQGTLVVEALALFPYDVEKREITGAGIFFPAPPDLP